MDAGRLHRTAFNRATALMESSGCQEGAALLELGLLTPKELFVALKDQVRIRLLECFGWPHGAFIIDPPATSPRPPADEMVVVLNAFDTNFDAENEVYAANTVASFYVQEPIRVQVGQLVRMYVVNLTEFDLINSMHLHGMFFDVFKTGTSMTPSESTDTIMLCQGERAILETTFRYPGEFMFHAHQSEFAELGWMGLFRAEARSAA